MRKFLVAFVAVVALCTLADCSAGKSPQASSSDGSEPKASDYVEAPYLIAANRLGATSVSLTGRARADAIVRLSSPEGQSWGMTAGSTGDWSFTIPVTDQPRMLSLTAENAGRSVHAEGALILLPTPAITAVVARVGYGAIAVATRVDRPVIVALDYDSGGGAMVSGLARPGAAIKLLFDGVLEGEARADSAGRFTASAVKQPLSPGDHVVRVETADGAAQLATRVAPTSALRDKVYLAQRQSDGWRLDWRSGEHAVQSTVIFDSAQQLLEASHK